MTAPTTPAETYEQYMVPTLFGPWSSHLVGLADPHPGERILDVACGTGIAARRVAPVVGPTGKIAGIDLNPDMLDVARKSAMEEGLDIQWHEGRAEHLPFRDGVFDLALCQFGLMFFTDRQAALAEMHRVLTDRGHVALSVWQGLDHHPFYRKLHEVIQERLGMSSVEDIFALGDADQLRRLLIGAGFRRIQIKPVSMSARFPNPEAFLAGEIDVDTAAIPTMQHLDAKAREEITAAISDDMAADLHNVTDGDSIVMPFHAHLVRASR